MHLNKKFDCTKRVLSNTMDDLDSRSDSFDSNITDDQVVVGAKDSCRKCGKLFYGKWKLNKHLNKKFDCAMYKTLGRKPSPVILSRVS